MRYATIPFSIEDGHEKEIDNHVGYIRDTQNQGIGTFVGIGTLGQKPLVGRNDTAQNFDNEANGF